MPQMQVVYVGQPFPTHFRKSIMLAGPTPRSDNVPSWRPEALRLLREMGYDGVVFVPETSDGVWKHNYDDQIEAEERMLHMSDCIVFWVPRDLETMPAFTTNDEWGTWKYSGKVVFGAPQDAPKTRYQSYYAEKLVVPRSATLADTLRSAIDFIGEGALRLNAACEVPLHIWKTSSFQKWHSALVSAGNRLDGVRVEWTFRVGEKKSVVFCWALHANVYVAKERRNKTNEVVISRPDISCVCMHGPVKKDVLETDIVLVREFRSTCSNAQGFVYELPGGSTFCEGEHPLIVAAEEVEQETGLRLDPLRLVVEQKRQLVATFSAHSAFLFSVQLTHAEINALRERKDQPNGALGSSERTYVEVKTLREVLVHDSGPDWSTVGMIMSVLYK